MMPAFTYDTELACAHQTKVRRMVELHGSATQVDRFNIGDLPEDELRNVARHVLYRPFEHLRRWVKIPNHCPRSHADTLEFTTRPTLAISDDEWQDLEMIRHAVTDADSVFREWQTWGTVDSIDHVGICRLCKLHVVGRAAVIRVTWAGRELTREYALGGAR